MLRQFGEFSNEAAKKFAVSRNCGLRLGRRDICRAQASKALPAAMVFGSAMTAL
jgi:hypothetical protein